MIELEEFSELLARFDDPGIVKNLFKEGKISVLTIRTIQEETLCETFGWTPKQLNDVDTFYIDAFTAFIKGREKGLKDKVQNPKK